MEDRLTQGLYFELGGVDPDRFFDERGHLLLERPGVRRVSLWENLVPGRDELPTVLEDGTHLVIGEVDETFEPPSPPPWATAALHYTRFPRPSQGSLTGQPTIGLLVVLISPTDPANTSAVRDWGDFIHLRHIAETAVPGFTQITPYEHATGGDPRFLHFYEMDTADPEAAYQAMPRLVAERLGGYKTEAYSTWADWIAAGVDIHYCNTFRLVEDWS